MSAIIGEISNYVPMGILSVSQEYSTFNRSVSVSIEREDFVEIRSQLFELSWSQKIGHTDRHTDREIDGECYIILSAVGDNNDVICMSSDTCTASM